MTELIENIRDTIDKKKVKSYCNKKLKKCSFKSERDLQNISGLATWLYIYGYYDEMIAVCDLVKDMEFEGDYDIWFVPEMTMCLKARVFRERGMLREAQILVDKINEHRDPGLYVNLVDIYEENMDENIAEELKNRPRSLADGWRLCKLQFAINYREPGGFPIPDEKFDNDIQELTAILRQVK